MLTEDTADLTMALIMAVARRIVEGANVAQAGDFTGWTPTWMMGHRITGKRLGIIGMGRIGQAVARRARAFGLQIHYHNRKPVCLAHRRGAGGHLLGEPRPDAGPDGHRHRPLAAHAGHLSPALGAPAEAAAAPRHPDQHRPRRDHRRDGAGRPAEAGAIAGAGLDVFEFEPKINPKLLGLPNAVLLPHLGSATIEGRIDMGEKVIINIRTWMDGHKPPDRVIPSMM